MSFTLFIHGLESNNRGTKSVFFMEKYPHMVLPNFEGFLQERMEKLRGIVAGKSAIRIIGSSFGGLMGSLFAMESEAQMDRLILLAPALNLIAHSSYQGKRIAVPVWIYHGRDDKVIPLEEIEPVAKRLFENLSFHVVDDDHFLRNTFRAIPWDSLLMEQDLS